MQSPPLEQPKTAEPRFQAIIRQSTAVLSWQVLMLAAAVINNFLVARLLGPEGKGLLYLLMLISGGFGLTVLHAGLGPAAVYYLGRERGYTPREIIAGTYWSSLFFGSLPLLVFAAGAKWLAPLTAHRISNEHLWIALAVLPPMVTTFNVGYVSLALGDLRRFNHLRSGQPLIFCVAVVVLFLLHQNSTWLVMLWWLASVFAMGIYAVYAAETAGGSLLARGGSRFVGSALRFGWKTHAGAVTQYLQHRIDVVLVAYFLPIRELGIYSLAISLVELLWYLPQAVSTVLMPQVASSNEEEANKLTSAFVRATFAATAACSVVVALAGMLVIPQFVPAFAGAVRLLWLLVPGVVAASIFKVLSSNFIGRGEPLKTFMPALVALVIEIAVGVYVVPQYGTVGAALLATFGYVINAGIYVYLYAKASHVSMLRMLLLNRRDVETLTSAIASRRRA